MRAMEKLLASKRLLVHISRDFAPVALFQSFCPEDLVLADLIYSDLVHDEYRNIHMFTVDTGRLPEEILLSMASLRERYGDILKIYHPSAQDLEQFDVQSGLHPKNQPGNHQIRLFKPVKRALQKKNALVTASDVIGETKAGTALISWDSTHQLPRFNPLARWTSEEVHAYVKHYALQVPAGMRLGVAHARDNLNRSPWWWQLQPGAVTRVLETAKNIA